MMFIRHEIFARRGRGERRRNFIIATAIVLLLLIAAVVYRFVHATTSYNLDGANGLTSGNIAGLVSATDGSGATGIYRDDKVALEIVFNIDDNKAEDALQGGVVWVYDLNSLVGNGKPFSAVEDITTPQNIYDSTYSTTEPVGTFTVSNNTIQIEITNATYVSSPRQNIRAGVSVMLDLDKVGVGPKDSISLVLPGSSDGTTSYDTPDEIVFVSADIDVEESVYDDEVGNFRTGNTNVSIDKNGNDYIATYTTEFMTNAYFPDLTTTITLTGDQTFVGANDFVMATCTSNYCIANSGVDTITIPSQYVSISQDGKTATIQMESFLYDYCEVGNNCTVDGATVIKGYELNDHMWKNANYSDYYIMYHANLGSTNPTESSNTYTATAVVSGTGDIDPSTGASRIVSDSSTVSFGANGYISGSKTGTCAYGSETSGDMVTCSANNDGDIDINYVISIADNGESLNKVKIEDLITDNQVLQGDIIVKRYGSQVDTISTVCANSNDTNCINPAAIDATYSKNDVRLFVYDFGNNNYSGPVTLEYTLRVAKDATLGSTDINNKVNLTIDQTQYNDIWHSRTHYDFDVQDYIKKEAYAQASQGVITWTVRVYGPITEGQSFDNVLVQDTPSYEVSRYPLGSINTVFTSATRIAADGTRTTLTSSDYTLGNNLDITIHTIGYNEEVDIVYTSTADNTFKEAYAGQGVQVSNEAKVDKDSSWASATILTPTADVVEKTVEESDIPGYWHDNGSSYEWNNPTRSQSGYKWTVAINANKGSVDDDYEPYFTDTIPAGLYLTDEYWKTPSTTPSYTGDSATDISQANFNTYIQVYRVVENSWSSSVDIPVTVTNGVIAPVNLAYYFNDSNCTVGAASPTTSCAGINGAAYYISYYTSIANEIHDDYLNSKTFANYAYLEKSLGNDSYQQRASDSAEIVYKTNTAIQKDDSTSETLDDTNTILYVITVNKDGFAFNNDGTPYASEADRQKLTVTDTLQPGLGLVTDNLVANSTNYTTPIVCTDNSNVEKNDCSFGYDSETRTITVLVPDGVLRKIQFKAFLTEPEYGVSLDFYNKANLVTKKISFSDDVSKRHIATKPSGWVSSDGVISLEKVDGNTLAPIANALFNVEDVEYEETSAGSGSYTTTGNETHVCVTLANNETQCDLETGSDGTVTFENLNGFETSPATNLGNLYYWVEKYVPSPYIADEHNKHYFMVYNEGANYTETAANKALAESVANSIIANSNGDITSIVVLKSTYRWVVTNTEQQVADLEIQKLVKGNYADPTDRFTIDITAKNSDDTDINGNFRVEYYNVNDPTTTTLTGSVTFTNSSTSVTLAHNEGVRIVGLYIGGDYTVEEQSTDYETSYGCQEIDGSGTAYGTLNCSTLQDKVSGTIREGTQIATITNTSEDSSILGNFTNKSALLGIFTAAGIAMAGFAVMITLKLRRG